MEIAIAFASQSKEAPFQKYKLENNHDHEDDVHEDG